MSGFALASPRQADDALARFFANDAVARVRVCEQAAFRDAGWLDLGAIELFVADQTRRDLTASVRQGGFAWRVPPKDDVAARLRDLLCFDGITGPKKQKEAEGRLAFILNSIASIGVRTGLIWPRFDARSLGEMPFRRPTTVVADTSGVLQGAMNFIADHLYPMARLKIPAVVHMEVINQADRFLKTRRTAGVRGEIMLAEHLLSQTGQRALLRLEMREDTEVERNLLLGDPLRSAFREDRDPDLRELNLSVPLKSYVDRMILEAARQHQSYASPGHPIYLLTADQGLAKMALAEGVKPLFFKAVTSDQLFGATLSGALMRPFSGKLAGRPLAIVLWELATAFGRVRLERDGDAGQIEVVAIDKDLGWSSFHSHDDLLWFRSANLPEWPAESKPSHDPVLDDILSEDEPDGNDIQSDDPVAEPGPASSAPAATARAPVKVGSERPKRPRKRSGSDPRLSDTNKAGVPFYRLTASGLVRLVDGIAAAGRLDDAAVAQLVGAKHPTALAEYRRFLTSGGFLEAGGNGGDWVAADRAVELATAQRELDLGRMSALLCAAPSYARFVELLADHGAGNGPVALPMPPRVTPTYLALGEITGVGANVPGPDGGYFPTLNKPDAAAFAAVALQRYHDCQPLDGLVSVGEWLERLIMADGIHPTTARDLLQEADAADLLRRSTEGSTTDTRHDDHTLRVITVRGGKPTVETIHLYRGDFLIPNKSSSSLRLDAVGS